MIKPQLANKCENAKVRDRLLADPAWYVEQKLDGKRVLIVAGDGKVQATNRAGDLIDVPANLRPGFERFCQSDGSWIVDGELIAGKLWLFDLPVGLATISPTDPYSTRRDALEAIYNIAWADEDDIQLVPVMRTEDDKRALYDWCLSHNAEGIMLKNRDGAYHSGRRSDDLRKVKFTETVDCVIKTTWREGKRSIGVDLFENGIPVDVGSVTMSETNLAHPLCVPGQVVEIKYLYVAKDRRLYQPRFLGFRDDKKPEECTIDQLKFTDKTIFVP